MAAFAYSAINAQGLELSGEINAPDPASASEQLRIRGLLTQRLKELPASGEGGARGAFKSIKPKSLQIFSRQFATMIEAGLNVVGALVILEEQTVDKYLAAAVKELRADVEGGPPRAWTSSSARDHSDDVGQLSDRASAGRRARTGARG